jgi:protein gp37
MGKATMSQKTKIEWCDSTVNPVMGCDGCELWSHAEAGVKACYAGELTQRYGATNKGYPDSFDLVTEFPGRMLQAARWKDLRDTMRPGKPWLNGMARHIFISDMADALSKAVGFEYLRDQIILNVGSDAGRRHKWLWLTKVPSRMVKFSEWLLEQKIDWPDNLMAMTSITSQTTMARLGHLLNVRCKFRGVSFEPLWQDVGDFSEQLHGCYCQQCKLAIPHQDMECAGGDFGELFCPHCSTSTMVREPVKDHGLDDSIQVVEGLYANEKVLVKPTIDWAIVGGQSGSSIQKPMYPAWAANIRDHCRSDFHRIPYFFKQWGLYAPWDCVKGSKVRRNYHVNPSGMIKTDHKWPEGDQVIMHRMPDKSDVRRTLESVVWSEMPSWKLKEEAYA